MSNDKRTPAKVNPRLRCQGRNPEYATIVPEQPKEAGVRLLREWQPEAFQKMKDARFGLLVAPCGGGKSTLQCALAAEQVRATDGMQRQLILVPQSHISAGFCRWDEAGEISIKVWNNSQPMVWRVDHDFCNTSEPRIMAALKAWLLRDPVAGLGPVAATTSHAAFARLWSSLDDSEKAKAVRFLTLRIDEAHHVNGICGEEGLDPGNEYVKLGDACRYILGCDPRVHAGLHLTTATPFRGDHSRILSDSVRSRFAEYWRDWVDHWKTLKIEDFKVRFLEYRGSPTPDVVAAIASERQEKHLWIVPAKGRLDRMSGEDGDRQVQEMIADLRTAWPEARILDLVTQATQDQNKALLLKEPKTPEDGAGSYDVVLTCMLGREGTDWCPCSRIHHTSPEGSSSLAVQTIGRAFRKFKGKRNVKIDYYIPEMPKPGDDETGKRELLSDRTNCLLVLMQINDMSDPILVTAFPKATGKSSRKAKGQEQEEPKKVRLEELIGPELVQQLRAEMVEMLALPLQPGEDGTRRQALENAMKELMEANGLDPENKEILLHLVAQGARMISPVLRDMGIDVSFLRESDFDKVQKIEQELASGSALWGTDELDEEQWAKLREILDGLADEKKRILLEAAMDEDSEGPRGWKG
jgi:hypothetical protein